jgi:hypothetical protein
MVAAGVALISLAGPAGADAKPRQIKVPPNRIDFLSASGSHGYRISVEQSHGQVILTAARKGSAAEYAAAGSGHHGDGIHAGFPGVGRVSVRFEPAGRPRKLESICSGPRSVRQPGLFRGTIAFTGERGFTRVAATHARGYVEQSFSAVCKEPKGNPFQTPDSPTLETTSRSHGRLVGLEVVEFPTPPALPDALPALTVFSASRFESRRGMLIVRSVFRSSTRDGIFTVEGSADRPETATISPPPPFHGTATFHAAPGENGKWEGLISVALPGVGPVQLTGAAFESQLCVGERCVGGKRARNASTIVAVRPGGARA